MVEDDAILGPSTLAAAADDAPLAAAAADIMDELPLTLDLTSSFDSTGQWSVLADMCFGSFCLKMNTLQTGVPTFGLNDG